MFSVQFDNANRAENSSSGSALNLTFSSIFSVFLPPLSLSLSNTCTCFPPQGANQSFYHYTNLSQSCQYSSRPCRGSQASHCLSGSCPHMSTHALSALIQELSPNTGGKKRFKSKGQTNVCSIFIPGLQKMLTVFFSACLVSIVQEMYQMV